MKTRTKDQWVKPFLKKYKGAMILALILGVFTIVCACGLMFTSGYLISKAATMPENILMIYVPIVLTRAFGIGRPAFRYAERLTSHNWVLKMVSSLRLKLYQSLENDAIFLKNHQKTGDLLGMLTDDIDHLENLYLTTIFPTVVAWLVYGIVIICLGFFSWWFALMMALVMLVLLVLFPLCSMLINGAKQLQRKTETTQLYNDLTDNVLGVSDWIFSQRSQDYIDYHRNAQKKVTAVKNQISHINSIRNVVFQGAVMVIMLITTYWAANHFSGNDGQTNWIAAFVLAVLPLMDAFRPLSAAAEQSVMYKESTQRLNQLPAVDNVQEDATLTLHAPYELKISHLSFKYAQKQVLNDINLDIQAHEKIAILGRSGSGKSTLLNLIRGDLVPTAGEVTLNGVQTADLTAQISNYIGVIDQEPYLFNTSILNNVRMGNEQTSEADVWEVLAKVQLADLVKGLPQGIRTNVEEAGMRFSGGERQRIALARILLKNPPIVLLDEPTVGLDPITEQAILNTFFETLKHNTIIWVTHHLQGVNAVDQVVFIEDGNFTLKGTPTELMKTNSHYQQLMQMDAGFEF